MSIENFTSISISFARKNGLVLKKAEEQHRTGYNLSLNQILDRLLENDGVLELSDKELEQRLDKIKGGTNHQ